MSEVHKRKLTQTEAKRHFIYIEWKYRNIFPSQGKIFKIKVGKEDFEVSVDKKGRIWSSFYNYFPHFEKGDLISISKETESVFKASSNKTSQ